MGKYLLRYLLFWLPAILVFFTLDASMRYAYLLHWLFAFFLLFGWAANTGMAAYHEPLAALSLLLAYAGGAALCILAMYSSSYTTVLHKAAQWLGGLLCFWPLDVFVRALQPTGNHPWELVVLGIVVAACAAGYLAGLVCRSVRRLRPSGR